MNRSPLTALLVATLLGVATAASAVNPENHQKSATAPLDFELADARGFVRLSSLPPQTTLINFWRADCPPCLREMPLLAGFDAPYVPGWDCHGLPIEHKVEVTHGKNLPADKVRELCRAYAAEQIEIQKADFIRLGVLGDWDNPYRTMDFANEANEIRALAEMTKNGYVFKGLKPVNWCFDCGSALAEAEVEYADKPSPTIDVAFPPLPAHAPVGAAPTM